MKTQEEITKIITEFKSGLKLVYGSRLNDVILYGSYARNEQNGASDVDLMVLVNNLEEKDVWVEYAKAADLIMEFSVKYDLLFSFQLTSHSRLEKSELPYFNNMRSEGVFL